MREVTQASLSPYSAPKGGGSDSLLAQPNRAALPSRREPTGRVPRLFQSLPYRSSARAVPLTRSGWSSPVFTLSKKLFSSP